MKNIPKFIYLQAGLEQYGESCEDFNELDNISWCVDKIYGDDLKFISVDLISAQIEKLEMELVDSKDKVGLTRAIVELRKLIKT